MTTNILLICLVKILTQSYSVLSKINIKKIVCNNNVTHLITSQGNLFSWGEDTNKLGILGLAYNFVVKEPMINSNVINKKIIDISMSESHCCFLEGKN